MADALASGASVLRDVGVQVPLRPPRAVQLRSVHRVRLQKCGLTFCFGRHCRTGPCQQSLTEVAAGHGGEDLFAESPGATEILAEFADTSATSAPPGSIRTDTRAQLTPAALPTGFLPWGGGTSGAYGYWHCSTDDPNTWPVFCVDYRADLYLHHPGGVAAFLARPAHRRLPRRHRRPPHHPRTIVHPAKPLSGKARASALQASSSDGSSPCPSSKVYAEQLCWLRRHISESFCAA